MTENTNTPRVEYKLSEKELEKIKAEVIARKSITDELKSPEAPQSKTWQFLNSSFGLFLLSSVLLTGMSSIITNTINSNNQKNELKKNAITELTELDYRISHIEFLIPQIDSLIKHDSNKNASVGCAVEVTWYTDGTDARFIPTDQKFQKTPMIGIMAWLKSNIKGLDTATVKVAYDKMMKFEIYKNANWIYDTKKVYLALAVIRKFSADVEKVIDNM